VLGLVGGGLGYALGLGFYRIMMFLGSWLMGREKLEWGWSVVGLALAIAAALLPSLRSALLAVKIYTPSAVRKVALPGEERESREEKIFKSFQERSFTMPIRLLGGEAPLFFGYIINNLKYMSVGVNERMEGLEELPEEETPKGDLKKQINFRYVYIREGTVFGTKNSLVSIKRKDEDFHRVNLICAPLSPGLSEKWVDRTVKIIHDMSLDWARTHEHTKS